ncbi:hypothetical protein GH714_016805 [Hevea brasiliensis]|uniref:Uncharacterized protein n=1 Tax=Hevea brasiliensis TaxID=3981 RepID=A0A6A6KQY1_HEVBR|nr:hypothetical protein GH714_016805 [Hevea brasiliensis]
MLERSRRKHRSENRQATRHHLSTHERSPETKKCGAPSSEEVVVEKPVTEKDPPATVESEPQAPEKPAPVVEEEVVAVEAEKPKETGEVKIAQSVSFKEETNVVGELPESQKKALDELKQLIQEALNKHEFTTPPPPPVKRRRSRLSPRKLRRRWRRKLN